MGAHISIPMYQRTLDQRLKLVGLKCNECGSINFPPKGVCRYCRKGNDFEETPLCGKGEIYTFTVISSASAPPEFAKEAAVKGSYPVAIVQLKEGPRVIAQIVDPPTEGVEIGMSVEFVIRRIYQEEEVIRYGYKFRVVEEGEVNKCF